MLVGLYRYLNRKKVKVTFNDLGSIQPASRVMGLDRGTPIDRYYMEKFLARHADLVRGRVLEIGDSLYTRRFGGAKVERSDVLHATPGNRSATIVGDLRDTETLPANAIDCFICTHTFHCIFEVQKAVRGACHMLKPGGVLLATLPGISQISRYDMYRWGDYWRFTTASVARLFEPVFAGAMKVESYGNVVAATAFLQGVAVEDLPDPTLLDEHDPDYQAVIAIVARKA